MRKYRLYPRRTPSPTPQLYGPTFPPPIDREQREEYLANVIIPWGNPLDSSPSLICMRHPALRHRALPALLAALLVLTAGTVAATTYKWTDANGRVVYSDQPPLGNIKSETVQGPPPPANASAVKDLTKQEGEFKKRQLEGTDSAKKTETQRVELVKRNEMCTRAQGQIRTLAAEQVLMVRQNEKGEDVYLDNTTRRKERGELEGWIKSNCQAG